ncbi:hypothetical protein T4E_1488 [Trichinella pseudospiralis]|uniref:Uncharacterized protein n=1 Tax=Trichinella pseudospiralis TaxID=6337 RepID=A0A0V0XJA2_TRIPS|nr:hypothetical protein T4E_1488 [Trichinella pseudospiralis]
MELPEAIQTFTERTRAVSTIITSTPGPGSRQQKREFAFRSIWTANHRRRDAHHRRWRSREKRQSSRCRTKNYPLQRPVFQAIMAQNQFLQLLRHICFDNCHIRKKRHEAGELATARE